MIGLTDTTHTLELATSSAASLDYYITWVDTTASAHTPGSSAGNIASATTTTVLAAPAAATNRGVKLLTLVNKGTLDNTVTIKKDISATEYVIYVALLRPGHMLVFTPDDGFATYDRQGRPMASSSYGSTGYGVQLYKVGTAADAANYYYFFAKDSGSQGAWSPGTSGVNGRATDGTAAADAGCLPLSNAASGYSKFLTKWTFNIATACQMQLWDVLWVNDALVVTTTGGQAITTPTLPARDINGSTSGEGCMIGLLFTAAATNAAAIANSTVTYTNSKGTGSRTATLQAQAGFQIPATPTVGTIVWFSLAAGDTGVRAISSISLGTSLVTGSVSLLIARPLVAYYGAAGSYNYDLGDPGVRIYDGACILAGHQASTTTGVILSGMVHFTDR